MSNVRRHGLDTYCSARQVIAVDAPWHVDCEVIVLTPGRYFLVLAFGRRDASFERLRSLVGGVYGQKIEVDGVLVDTGEPPGVPIPVEWSLRNDAGVVVAEACTDVLGANAFPNAEIARHLYAGNLDTGRYEFRAKLADGIREFSGIRARLRLEAQPK